LRVIIKIFSFVLILCAIAFAQKKDINFEHLSVEEGLSANTVLAILQDSRGFLWIGTYDGLNRYDGYKFIVYKNSTEDTTSISDNKIRALCEDKKGNLWIGTWAGGLNKFNRDKEEFKHYRYNPDNPSGISSDGIFALCIDETGNLWIGTEDSGVDYFNPENETFVHYKHNPDDPNSISGNSVYSVYIDEKGILWCGTASKGLNKFVKEKNKFEVYKNSPDDPESISGNQVAAICEDYLGNLWIGTRDAGLNKLNPSEAKFMHYKYDPENPNGLSDNEVWVVYEDSENLLWLGNFSHGINLFNRENETFTSYKKDYNNPESLSDDGIFSIYEDRSGVMWFGTWNGGLNRYDKLREKFISYSHDPNNSNSLSADGVLAIYKDRDGILWVGTDAGGLNRIDEKNNKFTHYLHKPDDPSSIAGDYVSSICEDKEGFLWISNDETGLNRLDRRTNKFQHYKHDPDDPKSISKNAISQVFCDSYGDLWIGTSGSGMDRLKRKSNTFLHYQNDPENPKSISSKMVYCFYEDKSGNLWIGTYDGGLMMYNRNTDDFTHYKYDPKNPFGSLSSNIISSICQDENGILWIGTGGGGLNRFDKSKRQFKHYIEKDGLANNLVYGVLNDGKGNLWISTGKGISKFNIKHESFTNYDKRDGLQDYEFNQWAYFKYADSEMYFGGIHGFSIIDQNRMKKNPHQPQVVITDFQLLHKPVSIGYDTLWERTILEKSITETKLIELNHDDNIISLEFAALDFHYPEKNNYAYMLEGFDNNWINTDAKRRTVTYTNLEPGEYVFKVKGSNNDDVWNETGTSLKINIHSPWWATWWSYILYGLIFGFIFTGSTRFYLNRQRLRHQLQLEQDHAKKLEEIDEMKSSFYANISHEFRTPLMLILGPAEKLLSKITDDDHRKQAGLIKGNANKLLNLINQLLDLSKIEAGKLKLQVSPGNIAQFVKGIVMQFESIAEQKDITLKIFLEREEIEAYFDRDKLEKIISNIMSNAVKFTPKGGTISVNLNLIDHSLEIIVRDTGIGIPKSKLPKIFDRFYQVDGSHTREYEGTGIGLALTKELVELHKGQIYINSEEGKWTEVKIYFPLGKDHLSEDEIVETEEYVSPQVEKVEAAEGKIAETEDSLPENLVDKTIVLIVEDNPDVREYIKDALKEFYHIEEAANGEQGFRKAENFIPNLIISDIMMPKMDGYEMTKRIKQNEKTSHIPVILLTAKSDKESKLEGLGLGADDYLIKPFDTEELLIRIKNLIDTRRFLQEKFSKDYEATKKIDKPSLSAIDENFMRKILEVIEEHISEEEFSIEDIAAEAAMSRTQIFRKIKGLTGKSPSVYLRSVRLSKAKQMIKRGEGTISEISYRVGFSSPAYFSRCFKEEFGCSPSEQ
jgi:signal transduction histidine kinase/ligand-binding sensor domain-containing protein/DNA-binding response OmpR family regulator